MSRTRTCSRYTPSCPRLGGDILSTRGLILGVDFDEAVLLRIGRAYEQATEADAWREKRPVVLED